MILAILYIIIDESTDISSEKFLCVCFKYYSKTKNNVIIDYLSLIPVVETDSTQLYNILTSFLTKVGLKAEHILVIATDGANNLCGRNNSVFTLLRKHNPNIILIKCICHSLHLCV